MFHVPFLLKETASCLPIRESICFSFASENFGWEFRRSGLCVTPVFLQQQWGLTNIAVKTGALEVTSWMRVQSADIKFNSRALKPFQLRFQIYWIFDGFCSVCISSSIENDVRDSLSIDCFPIWFFRCTDNMFVPVPLYIYQLTKYYCNILYWTGLTFRSYTLEFRYMQLSYINPTLQINWRPDCPKQFL